MQFSQKYIDRFSVQDNTTFTAQTNTFITYLFYVLRTKGMFPSNRNKDIRDTFKRQFLKQVLADVEGYIDRETMEGASFFGTTNNDLHALRVQREIRRALSMPRAINPHENLS